MRFTEHKWNFTSTPEISCAYRIYSKSLEQYESGEKTDLENLCMSSRKSFSKKLECGAGFCPPFQFSCFFHRLWHARSISQGYITLYYFQRVVYRSWNVDTRGDTAWRCMAVLLGIGGYGVFWYTAIWPLHRYEWFDISEMWMPWG